MQTYETTLGAVIKEVGGTVRTGPFGTALAASEYTAAGAPVISVGEVGYGALRVTAATKRVPPAVTRRMPEYLLRPGDIVLGRKGAVDRSAIIGESERGYFLGSDGIRLRLGKGVDPQFIAYWFQTGCARDWLIRRSVGTTMLTLTQAVLESLPVRLPTLEEQLAISGSLRDAEDLVRELESRMAKKRAMKQGLMQELLTAGTRLPGFTEAWRVRKIGDFTQVKAGGTPSTSVPRYWGGRVRWMTSGEIHQKRVHEVSGRITADGLRESSAQVLPVETVLMALAGQGKTRGTVAVSRVQLATNQSIAGIFPSREHDSNFLYYNLDTRYDELRGESAGDGGRGGLNLTIIKKLGVYMPDVEEQRAIARVLAAVDDELDALELRLESSRAIKQGMMQELLTGRTRLVLTEGAA